MITSAAQRAILDAARLAPSADNSQPWRYRWREEALELWIDRQRSGRVSDAHYMLSDLAIGACIENITIQALALGLRMDQTLLPLPREAPLFAALLRWDATTPLESPLLAAIGTRFTDRRLLRGRPPSDDCRQRLSRESASFPGVELVWLDGGPRRAALKTIGMAETLRFASRGLHGELFSSIRFGMGRKSTCEEGLAPASLAVEAPLWPLFKAMRQWPLMRTLNRFGAAGVLGFRAARLPASLAPALCLLCVRDVSRQSMITAGRAMERVWLQATSDGLSVQPLAAAGVLAHGRPDIEPELRPRLEGIRARLAAISGGRHGILFLRMGAYSARVPARSGRRALATFSLDA